MGARKYQEKLFFYSYKKFTTNFTFYYTHLTTMQYYMDDAKGSEGQRLPQSLNIKTRNNNNNNNNNKMYIFRARIQITSYLSMALYNDKSL